MRKIIPTVLCLMLMTTAKAQVSNNSPMHTDTIIPKYYINGHFFQSQPKLPEGERTMTMLKDHEGNRIIVITIDGVDLTEDIVSLSIPTEQVRNAGELIEKLVAFDEMRQLTRPDKDAKIPTMNEPFPNFRACDIDGRVWTNDDVKGKVTVINLWYSGCGPCRAEMPELSTWKETFPEVMFFSATFHNADTTRKITKQHHFNWTHLINAKDMMKWIDGHGFPLTIVIDKNGIVRHIVHGTNAQKRQSIVECIRQL